MSGFGRLTAAGVSVAGLFLALSSWPLAALEVGEEAPVFELPGLRAGTDSEVVKLSDYRGKVVYVDFWASWCAPCVISTPRLNGLRNKLVQQGKPFEIVAINVDMDPEDGIDFLLDEPVQYVTVKDPQGQTPASYEVKGMPTAFLLDGNGKIRLIHEGFKQSDISRIEAEVTQLLAELP